MLIARSATFPWAIWKGPSSKIWTRRDVELAIARFRDLEEGTLVSSIDV